LSIGSCPRKRRQRLAPRPAAEPVQHRPRSATINTQTVAVHCAPTLILGITQAGYAAGTDTRIERRHDAVENTGDRLEDKQEFREERRDCIGEGPGCRSDNRQDKRQDTVDGAADRVDDRRDRRW
jgi:hypothetical protein